MADEQPKAADGDAEYPDISKFGGKSMAGAYAKGSKVMVGDEEVDLSTVPDHFADEESPAKS